MLAVSSYCVFIYIMYLWPCGVRVVCAIQNIIINIRINVEIR